MEKKGNQPVSGILSRKFYDPNDSENQNHNY